MTYHIAMWKFVCQTTRSSHYLIGSPSIYPYRRRVKDYKIVEKLIFLRGSCPSRIIRSVYSLFFFLTPCSHGSGQNSERRLVETVYCAFRIHGIFQTAHLNLRRANIIFARQKCFYLMIPLCLNACQHMAWHVSAQVAGTDSRAFVFKVQARSPRLFHCLALISFPC